MTAHLTTKHLVLRPIREDDARAVAGLINNPRISHKLTRVRFPYVLDDAHSWLATMKTANDQAHVFAIVHDHGLIGVIGLEKDPLADEAELGYWLSEQWWGKGLMSEAVRAVAAFAFSDLGYARIIAGYRHGNEASRRILIGLGFRHTGHKRAYSLGTKTMIDIATLEITRREWIGQREGNRE